MRQIVVREQIPVTPPQPWRREINLPPAAWFRGPWLSAQMLQEQRAEKENSDFKKWCRFFAWLISGVGFCGSVFAAYLILLATIGG